MISTPNPNPDPAQPTPIPADPDRGIPTTVWRLDPRAPITGPDTDSGSRHDTDDHDRAGTDTPTGTGALFLTHLARRLLQIYTQAGDTLLDLDDDPCLRDAAVSTARGYRTLTDTTAVPDAAAAEATTLLLLRWPRPQPARTPYRLAELVQACRGLQGNHASAIAVLIPTRSTPPTMARTEDTSVLRAVMWAAGWRPTVRIIAVAAGPGGDGFLYYATTADTDQPAGRHAVGDPIDHRDLLVFRPRPR